MKYTNMCCRPQHITRYWLQNGIAYLALARDAAASEGVLKTAPDFRVWSELPQGGINPFLPVGEARGRLRVEKLLHPLATHGLSEQVPVGLRVLLGNHRERAEVDPVVGIRGCDRQDNAVERSLQVRPVQGKCLGVVSIIRQSIRQQQRSRRRHHGRDGRER